jgi:hypothetical protein
VISPLVGGKSGHTGNPGKIYEGPGSNPYFDSNFNPYPVLLVTYVE